MPVGTDMGRFYTSKPVRPGLRLVAGWFSVVCHVGKTAGLEGEPALHRTAPPARWWAVFTGLGVKQPGVELALAPKLLIINLGVGRDGFKGATHRGRYFSYAPDSTQAL